jgi:hypothetical protein
VAVNEELGRHDVKLLADVLAYAHHRLAAIAVGAFGLVKGLDAQQVFGQRLAFGLAPQFNGSDLARPAAWPLQGFELCLQAGLVGGQRFFEQLSVLGVHALGSGGKAPSLQACKLVRDALNLDVANLIARVWKSIC